MSSPLPLPGDDAGDEVVSVSVAHEWLRDPAVAPATMVPAAARRNALRVSNLGFVLMLGP
jgi:hypothetical protein